MTIENIDHDHHSTLRYLQWQIDTFLTAYEQPLNVTSIAQVQAVLQQKLAQSICATSATFCNGTNQQYNSTEACESYLTNQVRFGQAYEWGMNTVTCRMVS